MKVERRWVVVLQNNSTLKFQVVTIPLGGSENDVREAARCTLGRGWTTVCATKADVEVEDGEDQGQ